MKMTLKVMFENWKKLSTKADLSSKDALKAVEADGDALMYVKEQTPEVCLKAVERNGDALRYVKEHIFTAELSVKA